MKIKSFRDLKIWATGKEIVKSIYKIVKHFPSYEQFGLSSQLQRCAVSIPSNIAEGFNRSGNNEYRRFLYISLGSCAELETQIEIAFDIGYLSKEEKFNILNLIQSESKMITALIKKM